MSGAAADAKQTPAGEAPTDDAVVVECDLEAAPGKVWRAIAEPDLRDTWLGQPEAGPAEVRRAEPPGRLDLVWPTHEGESFISFEIDPSEDGGSHLTITHRAPVTACVLPFKRQARMISGVRPWRMAA